MKMKISSEARLRIIAAYNDRRNMTEIARLFKCSKSTVHRIVKTYLEEERIGTKAKGGLRSPVLSDVHVDAIKSYIDDNCTITLRSIRRCLNEEFGVSVSTSGKSPV
jgi:transposase